MQEHCDLSNISTSELVRELATRTGVEQTIVDPHEPFNVVVYLASKGNMEKRKSRTKTGPAIILTITD